MFAHGKGVLGEGRRRVHGAFTPPGMSGWSEWGMLGRMELIARAGMEGDKAVGWVET